MLTQFLFLILVNMIKIIDINFLGINSAIASFLIKNQNNLVLIETGPSSSYNNIKKEINSLGKDINDIKHVFVTHIHLDHSGGAWKFAQNGATVYVHPKGAKHLQNPDKLIQSARKIYGNKMDMLWGKIKGIDSKNIRSVEHKEIIKIGNINLKSLHTPGHANHHISWKYNDVIFAGDVAGAKINNGPVLPACPPPDIDLELWEESLKILNDEAPKKLYLTHFGKSSNVTEHLEELKSCLWDWANWFKNKKNENKDIELLTKEFNAYVHESLVNKGLSKILIEQYYAANPPYMSVTGLLRYLNKKAKNDK